MSRLRTWQIFAKVFNGMGVFMFLTSLQWDCEIPTRWQSVFPLNFRFPIAAKMHRTSWSWSGFQRDSPQMSFVMAKILR